MGYRLSSNALFTEYPISSVYIVVLFYVINRVQIKHLLPPEWRTIYAPRIGYQCSNSIMQVCRCGNGISCISNSANLGFMSNKCKWSGLDFVQVRIIMQSPFWTQNDNKFATFATFGCHKHYSAGGRVYPCSLFCKHIDPLMHDGCSPTLVPECLVVVVVATSSHNWHLQILWYKKSYQDN